MWRLAQPGDDPAVGALARALHHEDPGPIPFDPAQIDRTLAQLRAEPVRGRTAVLELNGRVAGYALLISFWSNEFEGEVCVVDELYVEARARGQGHGTALLSQLGQPGSVWPARPVAIDLEVNPANTRARALYRRLGFTENKRAMRRVLREG